MIYDLLSILRQMGDPGELAAASYSLKEGLYIRFDGNSYEVLLLEKKDENVGELFEWFRATDFYSCLAEMNKPVDPKKKIHSNNIYTLFFKFNDPEEITNDTFNICDPASSEIHINRYFDALSNWYSDNKKILSKTMLQPIDKKKMSENKEIFVSNLPVIADLVKEYKLKPGRYIKLFVKVPISDYKHASDLYLLPKIFNKNDYNIEICGEILGLSNANMGTNSKKPYLEHKTTTFEVPYRIALNEALDIYRLMQWLSSQNKEGRPVASGYLMYENVDHFELEEKIQGNTSAQFVHLERDTGVTIDDYETLPQAIKDLKKPLRPKNYLHLSNYDNKTITEMYRFEEVVDDLLFNGYLVRNYYNNPKPKQNVFSSQQVALLQISKNAFLSFFKKYDDRAIRYLIDKISLEMVLEKFKQTDRIWLEETSFAKALNLRFALLEYFETGGKEKVGSEVTKIYEELKEKVFLDKPDKPLICNSDQEFYFASGQLARFLISLSRAQRVNYNFINPLLRAKNGMKIKQEIITLITKYGHEIEAPGWQYRNRFDNLQAIVNGYDNESSEAMLDLLLAGFASPNIIYFKKEEL